MVAVENDIGENRAFLGIERLPLVIAADHLRRRPPGQLLAGLVPDDHPVPAVEDKGGNSRNLQQIGTEFLLCKDLLFLSNHLGRQAVESLDQSSDFIPHRDRNRFQLLLSPGNLLNATGEQQQRCG